MVVPLQTRKMYAGIVYRLHNNKPQGVDIKDIIQVIDQHPIVLPIQFKLWEWISQYYMCTLGEVMKAALPAALKLESETYLEPATDSFEPANLTPPEQQVMFFLRDKKKHTIQDVVAKSGVKGAIKVIKALISKDLVEVVERLGQNYQPKTVPFISFTPQYQNHDALNTLIDNLKRAPQQEKLIMAMLSSGAAGDKILEVEVRQSTLLKRLDLSSSVVNTLIVKGILKRRMVEVSRIERHDSLGKSPAALNEAQQKALDDINKQFETHGVTLLHGVTSSGKTEIYIHLMAQTLEAGRQVLYLLPEIALTAQIINRLRNVFGERVGIYHSKYGDARRAEVYNGVINHDPASQLARYSIILGVRSSVFMPFNNLGLIIVDEEHENTYKQDNPAPRYNARDVAVVLGQFHGAKVLLGTATPSIESFYNAQFGKYGFVELSTRFRNMALPEVKVVNLRKARRDRQMHSHFSQTLIQAIDHTLQAHEQIILFQNRRGFAPVVECDECGWVPHCEHCDVALTYHKFTNQLVCHYCGFSIKPPTQCLACGSKVLKTKGFGTEKLEDELAIIFPNARIKRLDLDTTRSRMAYETIIDDFQNGDIDVLIGTQMVTKGLDFDRVSLVGILNADSMLNYPDFRAFERSYQLMSQVCGRAGRKGRRGLVILQSAQPEHTIVQEVVNQQYTKMYNEQIAERLKFKFPPFCRLIGISLRFRDKYLLAQIARDCASWLRESLGNGVLGPEPPLVERVQNLYIQEILVKVDRSQALNQVKELIAYYTGALRQRKDAKSLQIYIDVDPM